MGKMMMIKFGMSHMAMWKIWLIQWKMMVWVMCLVTDVGGVRDLPRTELSSAAAVDSSELLVSPSPLHLLRRSNFPDGFVFGTSSASYQYEGGVHEGGRGPCVWDTGTHMPGIIADNTTGDVANDHYHRYKEDVDIMADLGLNAYRFSIAWTRIFPDGMTATVNPEGIAFYNRLIDTLLSRGIEPFVTLSHFDLPQTIQHAFGGWRNRKIVPLFQRFAETCFAAFGDRVKHWVTFNEIHMFSIKWRNIGCDDNGCGGGNSKTWAYTTAHHMLLSHAAAVDSYRTKFQAKQRGKIGMVLDMQWYVPLSETFEDAQAVDRLQAFQIRWILDPIYFGRYPEVLQTRLGDRLPKFSESEVRSLRGSVDFLGINHYTTHYGADITNASIPLPENLIDAGAASLSSKDGVAIGPTTASSWLNVVPWGIYRTLNYLREQYNNPVVYITENGMDEDIDPASPIPVSLHDPYRIQFYHDYLLNVIAAVRDGCDVRGYFIWSLLDNFEWSDGLSKRFGIYYVDYAHNLTRHPKDSAKWFKQFLHPEVQPERELEM